MANISCIFRTRTSSTIINIKKQWLSVLSYKFITKKDVRYYTWNYSHQRFFIRKCIHDKLHWMPIAWSLLILFDVVNVHCLHIFKTLTIFNFWSNLNAVQLNHMISNSIIICFNGDNFFLYLDNLYMYLELYFTKKR